MPRKKLNFPSRAQRRELLEKLRAQTQTDPQLAQDEKYKAYLDAWAKLDQTMETLSAEDENGVPKLLEEQDADALAEDMIAAATAGEEFLAAAEWNGKKYSPAALIAEDFQTFLAKDFGALKAYDPAVKKLSLAEVQESARTQVIDLRERNLGSMSNLQNERIPMSIVNAKGEQRPGVFTKPTYVRVKGKFQDIIDKAKEACGNPNDRNPAKAEAARKAREKFDNFLASFRNVNAGIVKGVNGKKLRMDTSDDLTVGMLINYLDDVYGKNPMTTDHAIAELSGAGIPGVETIPKAALKAFAQGLTDLKKDVPADLNAYQLQLADGTRLDNRNVGMTAIADALGMGSLLARSESMKFIGDDGQVTEGTFMEYGKGVDLYQKEHLFEHVAANPYGDIANRSRLFKQISDLQVLDYLGFNRDRHPGNIFYEFDDQGRIIGIQGIDNDSSLGAVKWSKFEVSRLGVIAKSTAEKIEAMKPEMLRFSLRGRGLTAQEINASVERLRDLQDGIRNKKVKIVEDDQLGRRDIKDYYPPLDRDGERNGVNMFLMMDQYVTKKIEKYRDPNKPFVPMPRQPKPTLREVAAADRRYTVGGLADQLGRVSRLVRNDEKKFNVDDLTTRTRGSSQFFRDLVTAAKRSSALQRQILEDQNLDKSKMMNEAESLTTLAEVNESFETLQKMATEYLQYKLDHSKVRPKATNFETLKGKNPYEQSHIDYARNILKTVENYQKSMARPDTEAEKENMNANRERRELENRRAEKGQDAPQQGQILAP